jgi:hypothetical protein
VAGEQTYSSVEDLLTGNVPLPTYLDPQKFVNDAAKEIDSKIGFLYVTPVNVSTDIEKPVSRPVRLLLERINNHLASGRLLMALDSAGEDTRVHAYALRLVDEASMALEAIASGKIDLDGAPKLDEGDDVRPTSVLIGNLDAESNVEAFYDRIANPNFPLAGFGIPNGLIR